MSTFTHFDPKEIKKSEKEMLQFLKDNIGKSNNLKPTNQTISNVLSYSRALSVKKSTEMEFIENILN